MSLPALIPLILILMTITGAVYPAIDLTAGERERGTLEILVAAPVPRFELLTAKYFAVVAVAVLTAMVNLVSMTITLTVTGLGRAVFSDGLSPLLLAELFALLLLFAAFFSAVLLGITSFARSFKEAQAYLIPLMLASLAPGVLAMMPGLKLAGLLTVVPLVNIVLLARDLMNGDAALAPAGLVALTTALYAVAALSLAARVFGAESVLYSEQSGWADVWRRPDEPQPTAGLPAALWCLALTVPLSFALQWLTLAVMPATAVGQTVAVAAITALLFAGLPLVAAYHGRVRLASGFGLVPPRPAAVVAGLLLGASLWPFVLAYLAGRTTAEALEEQLGPAVESMRQARAELGLWALVGVVVPALCEELFFRGFLFQALRRHAGPLVTIGVTGLLFGVTHVVLGGALGLERLVPSTVLGLILGTVCWTTGSVWPSLLLHVGHNALLVLVGQSELGQRNEIAWEWLAGGATGIALGVSLLLVAGRRPAPD